MNHDLQVLADARFRQQIILAELAGLLHNLGKLDPNFLPNQVVNTSAANAEIRRRGQFVNGYQFKRFAQPSADLLAGTVKSVIASPSKLDTAMLPPVAPDDLGEKQVSAAKSFNRFFRGVGPLDNRTASRLRALQIQIVGEQWSLPDLLTLFWDKEFVYKADGDDYQRQYALSHWLVQTNSRLPLLLALAHGEMSGSEKYLLDEDPSTGTLVAKGVRQQKNQFEELRVSTPFGYEPTQRIDVWSWQQQRNDLLAVMPDQVTDLVKQRCSLLKRFEDTLKLGLGDTQWPVNEITLWDYASSIATLFKTSIAKSLVEGKVANANEMRWRLLGLRFDGLDYRFQTNRLADLIARNEVIQKAFNTIQQALEVKIPVGNEVYRDEHGAFFVVPDIDGMSTADWQQQIQSIVQEALVQEKIDDVWPRVTASVPLRGKRLNLGVEIARLSPPMPTAIPPTLMAEWWREPRDNCVVCQQRPQGFVPPFLQSEVSSFVAGKRKLCGVCFWRRQGRARKWLDEERFQRTIWIDEVADVHGRFALITASFDLENWLSGEMIETLALGEDESTLMPVSKFASFPRVQRVWRTTSQFWQGLEQELQLQADAQHPCRLRDGRRRLMLELGSAPSLDDLQVYELNLGRTSLSLIWDSSQQKMISIDNLSYIAVQMDLAPSDISAEDAALEVGVWIEDHKNNLRFTLTEPAEVGIAQRKWQVSISDIDYEDAAYAPVIPILAEPRTFMALVPANKALDAVQAIKAKYEREMGKVRNRLPLHLGVVYANRRTPLASVLDAGRRMLRYPSRTVQAHVKAISSVVPWPDKVTVTLAVDGRKIDVTIPTVMGDCRTPDVWYPYWQVAGKPTDRNRWFVGPDGEHWVHACDLRPDDTVAFTPSTFDFEYLDASARRFEVAYGEDGRRLGQDKKQRPYLLEEVEALEQTWKTISQALSTSQIKALESIVESKRRDWEEPTGFREISDQSPPDKQKFSQTFADFVQDALANSDAPAGLQIAALTGMLADALEIHMTLHKEKTAKDTSQKETSHA